MLSTVYFKETADEILYALRSPSWDLQWVFHASGKVTRHCYLFGDDGSELDPMNPADLEKIHMLLPILLNEYKACVSEIKHSRPALAEKIGDKEYAPFYFTYSNQNLANSNRDVND